MAASMKENVDLGFVEKVENWKLLSHFFPSKIGGKPAWLSLKPVPRVDDIVCGQCKKPCVFVCQVYSPESSSTHAFHRALFIFLCKDPKCYKRNDNKCFVVLRSQLARKNAFYSDKPPDEKYFTWSSSFPTAWSHQDLCAVCGVHGPKKCAKCHHATYCSREHQIADWKSGHREKCGKTNKDDMELLHKCHPFLFPEDELVTEPEDYQAPQEKSEADKMKEYEEFVSSEKAQNQLFDAATEQDLEGMAKHEEIDDLVFTNFKERISHEPEQVLRHDKGGTPLWVSSEGILQQKDIPNCQKCGSQRQFEFQILPQLLSHLNVDSVAESIDWGTLIVYTCMKSCDIGNDYATEFLWKQDFSQEELKQVKE